MIELALVAAAIAIVGGVLLLDRRQRRREARRRGDVTFLAQALVVAQRKRRVRPKADARIQRRRFGTSR